MAEEDEHGCTHYELKYCESGNSTSVKLEKKMTEDEKIPKLLWTNSIEKKRNPVGETRRSVVIVKTNTLKEEGGKQWLK